MHNKPKTPDFDTLMHMFRQDPEDFEIFRKKLLDEAASEAPAQHRRSMQHLLMRIETARQAASTPLEALAYSTRLMRESLDELSGKLQELQQELSCLQGLLVLERIRKHSQGAS